MQKLILIQNDETSELDYYLSQGWRIKDFKPVSESVIGTISCMRSPVYVYVLIEISNESSKILNE